MESKNIEEIKEAEERYVIKLITPLLKIKGQLPSIYMVTQEELEEVLGQTIKLGVIDINHRRFIREWEEVEVTDIDIIEKEKEKGQEGIRGFEEVIKTRKGKVKIVYTYMKIKVIYAKSKRNTGVKYFYRGYKIEGVRNVGLRMFDGLIPLNRENNRGTINIVKHNKRDLIRKGVKY